MKLVAVLTLAVMTLASNAIAQVEADAVDRALANFEWKSNTGDGVRVYYKPGSFAERHRHMLARSARIALDEALAYLGERKYPYELKLFYVETRTEMQELVGYPVTGYAVWSGHAVFLVVTADWRSFEKHEIAHVITMGEWGDPHESSRWMIEGIPIACDGWCRTHTVDEVAFHLLSNGDLPPLPVLFEEGRGLGEIIGGMYAGSLIDFVRETYGIDAVRDFWLRGADAAMETLGVTADELEASWRSHLERMFEDGVDVDYDTIDEHGCG